MCDMDTTIVYFSTRWGRLNLIKHDSSVLLLLSELPTGDLSCSKNNGSGSLSALLTLLFFEKKMRGATVIKKKKTQRLE